MCPNCEQMVWANFLGFVKIVRVQEKGDTGSATRKAASIP